MVTFSAWYPATGCTGSARPGAKALMSVVLANFSGARNLGIYNCRNARGTSTFSPHAEGRAIDVGFPMDSDGTGSAKGYALVNALLKAGPSRLGIQAIIYDRKIWSAKSPGGRRYTGAHPHNDHVHVEMTRSAADRLTTSAVRRILGFGGGSTSGTSAFETYHKGVRVGSRTLKRGNAGDDVKRLQRILNAWYPRRTKLKEDGYFGPKTEETVRFLQTRAKIKIDGIVGPQTWRVLRVL